MRTPKKVYSIAVVSLLALVSWTFAGCGGKMACTEIGCVGGLALTLETSEGSPIESFSGTVAGTSVDCSGVENGASNSNAECLGEGTVRIPEVESATVAVDLSATVDGEAVTYKGDIEPDYETSRPNGEGCPPVCKSAEETVTLTAEG